MIVGKIRVENYRGMSFGIYDENNRLHATAVTERVDLQAICDGYNAFVALQEGTEPLVVTVSGASELFPADNNPPAEEPRRGRGRPRKEQAATE